MESSECCYNKGRRGYKPRQIKVAPFHMLIKRFEESAGEIFVHKSIPSQKSTWNGPQAQEIDRRCCDRVLTKIQRSKTKYIVAVFVVDNLRRPLLFKKLRDKEPYKCFPNYYQDRSVYQYVMSTCKNGQQRKQELFARFRMLSRVLGLLA